MGEIKNTNLAVAKFALECVDDVIKNDKTNKSTNSKDYKTLVKKMNVLIQKNGMIGTLVFLLSKSIKNKHHKEVLKNIKRWCEEDIKLDFLKRKVFKDKDVLEIEDSQFIENITGLTSREYLFLTQEMMNLFGWIKRFSDGMIEGD